MEARPVPSAKMLAALPRSERARQCAGKSINRVLFTDALVAATAVELGADLLLTTDAAWPSLPLNVTVVAGM